MISAVTPEGIGGSVVEHANPAHEVGVFRYLHSGAPARHAARLLDADGLGASPISSLRALSRLVCRHTHLVPAYAGPGNLFFECQLRLFVFVRHFFRVVDHLPRGKRHSTWILALLGGAPEVFTGPFAVCTARARVCLGVAAYCWSGDEPRVALELDGGAERERRPRPFPVTRNRYILSTTVLDHTLARLGRPRPGREARDCRGTFVVVSGSTS